jgi:hypothetical protein
MEMKLLFGVVLFLGSVAGMLLSFASHIVVNSSSVPIFDGMEMSWMLGVFFIMAGLSGIYMILNHN